MASASAKKKTILIDIKGFYSKKKTLFAKEIAILSRDVEKIQYFNFKPPYHKSSRRVPIEDSPMVPKSPSWSRVVEGHLKFNFIKDLKLNCDIIHIEHSPLSDSF